MTGVHTRRVAPEDAELRLDRWFRRHYPGLGHGRLEKLLRTGQVRVDGKRARSGTRLTPGQLVRVPPLPEAPPPAAPPAPHARDLEALRRAVLYRDASVIAVDKAPGLAVQGGSGQRRHLDAMLEGLRAGAAERPRLVHRLDKDTSGVLLLARDAAAARRLSAAFASRAARKLYWALVVGRPEPARGRIDLALGKAAAARGEKVLAASKAAKPAETLYRVVASARAGGAEVSWLVLMPLTGRTHQLRAHCAALGTPILCDGKYGGRAAFPTGLDFEGPEGLPRQLMLQAHEIALPHPEDGTTLRVAAPLPAHMAAAFARLGFRRERGERAADELVDYAVGLAHSPPGTRRGRRGETP